MLRTAIAAFSVSLLALPAFADEPVHIADVSFGEALLDKADEYGPRELDFLADELYDDLEAALSGVMMADGTQLQARIIDASPNRPTREQLRDTPGLSYAQSFSRGGARLEAELIAADGTVLETFEYSWRTINLDLARHASTWSDARRTFTRFARTVGEDIRERETTGS